MEYLHLTTIRHEDVSYKLEGAEPIKFLYFDRPLIPKYVTVRWESETLGPWRIKKVFVNGPWINKNGTPSKRESSGHWVLSMADLNPELLELVESSKPRDED